MNIPMTSETDLLKSTSQ